MMIVAGLTAAAALTVAVIIITRGRKPKLSPQKPIDIPTTPEGSINKPYEVVNTIIEKEKAIEILKRRKEIELEVEKKAHAAQEKYNKPFDYALSNKSAEESAYAIIKEENYRSLKEYVDSHYDNNYHMARARAYA